MRKLWGGRFEKQTDQMTNHFHSSISFDKRLYTCDIEGSLAHAKMLGKQGILSSDEQHKIVQGLLDILAEIENDTVQFDEAAEDIHMNVEQLLIAKIGEPGKKLHTGRSRNDQVALDIRMYIMRQIELLQQQLHTLLETLVDLAQKHLDTIMPGYTHLQKAQPVTLSHHLLAYFEMFKRDTQRLLDCRKRVDCMPLGSGALAATTYPLDREYVQELLHFSSITANSLDAVSDRDFCIEYSSALSILMMHLSRFCEEIILWSTNEFQFVILDDAYSTGSSIMPQKKNPDMAELIRGKTGRVYGSLISLLVMMKGLPLAYNKDMQEDKEQIFDATDTVFMCLPVFCNMLQTAVFQTDVMKKGAGLGFTNATDVADYLVSQGVAFRDAHEITGKLVLYCIQNETDLLSLDLAVYKRFSPLFTEEVYRVISLEACINRRGVKGGPARERQLEAIAACREFLRQ